MKLGRKPRAHSPLVPHMSALLAGKPPLIAPPISRDWSAGMPADFGMMLNDRLGDCTAAAYYHALQIWSFNTGCEIDIADRDVEKLYAETSGYVPGDSSTDRGAVEQSVLAFLLMNKQIIAFVEVDTRNTGDIKRVINDCGVAYIGIQVPQSVMSNCDNPAITWDYRSGDSILGGHAIALVGYNLNGVYCISWGKKYFMTWRFFANYCDEAYAIADPMWVRVKDSTPAGLSVQALEEQMQGMRNAAF